MEKRPILNKNISSKDFQEFYWLKKELVIFCRKEKLKTTGSKIEITDRISNYLKTGNRQLSKLTPKFNSNFDWKNEELFLETKITDNYTNTENVRKFFQERVGKQFKFNIEFMKWMKMNCGKTLKDALSVWDEIKAEKKNNTHPKVIAPQFEYNTYLRDFMAANPNAKRALGIKLWKIKKSLRGNNIYKKEDLKFLK